MLSITHYSVSTREMQIKITNVVLLHTNHNWHHQKKSTNNAGEDIEKREPSCALPGNVH